MFLLYLCIIIETNAMILPKEIVEALRQKSGLQLHLPGDCKSLIDAIYAETNEMLGLSTVKRLLGIFADARSPRQSTLNIIARYLGYTNWTTLLQDKCGSDSDFDSSLQHFDVSTLALGTRLRICYHPGRVLEICHVEKFIFEVINYNGSKLHTGDRLLIFEIVCNYPLFIKKVVRDGESLGTYVAGRRNGVQEVSIYPPSPDQL